MSAGSNTGCVDSSPLSLAWLPVLLLLLDSVREFLIPGAASLLLLVLAWSLLLWLPWLLLVLLSPGVPLEFLLLVAELVADGPLLPLAAVLLLVLVLVLVLLVPLVLLLLLAPALVKALPAAWPPLAARPALCRCHCVPAAAAVSAEVRRRAPASCCCPRRAACARSRRCW
jgi:hypothetical protein